MSRSGITLLVLALTAFSSTSAAWTMTEFRDAMRSWASSANLEDPNDALATWRDPGIDRLCDFDGIVCGYYYDEYYIEHLDLDGLELTGAIPPWMWACASGSINLSNNQWYYTTVFYEDTSSGYGGDATAFLTKLNCSNCEFFLKAPKGEYVLPDEWSRYVSLQYFDFSQNPDLIGSLPSSWATAWTNMKEINFTDTEICEPFPLFRGETHIHGDIRSTEECKDLPEYAPWETVPPDPPSMPPIYEKLLDIGEESIAESSLMVEVEPTSEDRPMIDAEPIYYNELMIDDDSIYGVEPIIEAEPISADPPMIDDDFIYGVEPMINDDFIYGVEPMIDDDFIYGVEPMIDDDFIYGVEPMIDDDLIYGVEPMIYGEPIAESSLMVDVEHISEDPPIVDDEPIYEGAPMVDAMSITEDPPIVDAESIDAMPSQHSSNAWQEKFFDDLPTRSPEDKGETPRPPEEDIDLDDLSMQQATPVSSVAGENDAYEVPAEQIFSVSNPSVDELDDFGIPAEGAFCPSSCLLDEDAESFMIEDEIGPEVNDVASSPLLEEENDTEDQQLIMSPSEDGIEDDWQPVIHPPSDDRNDSAQEGGIENDWPPQISLQPPSQLKHDREPIDCDDFDLIDQLDFPSQSSNASIRLTLLPSSGQSSSMCDLYSCRVSSETATSIEGPVSESLSNNSTWSVRFNEDGQQMVTVIVTDDRSDGCTWTHSIRILVDTTPPVCQLDSYDHTSSDVYLVRITCSEAISLTMPNSIEVSKNVIVEDSTVHAQDILIKIQRLNLRLQSTLFVTLPRTGYEDVVGNIGVDDVIVEITVEVSLPIEAVLEAFRNTPVDSIVSGTIAASGGLSSGAAVLGGAGSGGGVGLQSNIIRTGFHLQFLAFTAHLAVPNLNSAYADMADQFSWTTLAFSGTDAVSTTASTGTNSSSQSRKLFQTSSDQSIDAIKGEVETDAFFKAVVGYGSLLGICLCLRLAAEAVLYCRPGAARPAKLTFPRLELQSISVTIPPMAFASFRLLMVGTPAAIELGLFAVVVLVMPFTVWYVCSLILRSLIVKPEIYFDRSRIENPIEAEPDSDFKKDRDKFVTTIPEDFISVGDEEVASIMLPVVLSRMPPHEEAIDDYVDELHAPFSSRVGSFLRLSSDVHRIGDRRSAMRSPHIFPATSEDETESSMRSRFSTVSMSPIKTEPIETITVNRAAIDDRSNDAHIEEWILRERQPEMNFVKKYGFAFDDVLGDDPVVGRTRLRWRFMITHATFFLHKVASASIFGLTLRKRRSPGQVAALLVFHLPIVGHLLIVRPYIDRGLCTIESIVHLLEFLILIGAWLLLMDVGVAVVNSIMIFSFLSATLLLGLFELRYVCTFVRMIKRIRIKH